MSGAGRRRADTAERETRAMAAAIVSHHLGSRPKRIVRKGGGLTNGVFEVVHAEGAFVIRLNPTAAKINHFLKEQWAIARAREAGVPTPEPHR